ncbi:MAG TPA: hypothetical protein VFC07_16370, partial [Verrucomicrobiae bacterium]|nr:hypothetical protein [Verrucomicrobiae bacterium]
MGAKFISTISRSSRAAFRCSGSRFGLSLLLFLPSLWPVMATAQFTLETNNGAITISAYSGKGGVVVIPDSINGLPVTSIGDSTFLDLSLLFAPGTP